MASNNISFVRGTTEAFEVDIVDEAGKAIPSADLEGAVAQFVIRTAPDAPTAVLTLVPVVNKAASTLTISLAPSDTASVPIALYVYQVSITLADGSYYDVIDYSVFDLNLGGVAATPLPAFDNTAKIDHNWELPDNLRYVTPGGTPIPDAQIRVYYKSDYDAGQLSHPIGITQTDAFGRWKNPVLVLVGYSYSVRMELPNQFGPDVVEVYA